MKRIWLMALVMTGWAFADNPVVKHMYTADPAALVYNDTFWLFTGHDVGTTGYVMNDWYIFSTTDMVNWTQHGACLAYNTFSWASGDAWASQCTFRNGKFYWYVCATNRSDGGKAVGVASADKITGPYTDPKGSAVITRYMTSDTTISWEDIDPSIYIDTNSQAYLYWGNHSSYMVRLKSNMYDTMGSIVSFSSTFKPWDYEEGPWVYKLNSLYYMIYAASFPEYTDYATASSPLGPWTRRGRIISTTLTCRTEHSAVLEYKGKWYYVYHSGALPRTGTGALPDYQRSVCIDTIGYNTDGTLKAVTMTTAGVAPVGPGPVTAGTAYRIVSRLSGKVLQVPSGSGSGAQVRQSTWAGTANQLWTIDSVGYGVYRIVNVQSGLCMDIQNGSLSNGALVQQLAYAGIGKHKWKLLLTPDGYVALINDSTCKAIDLWNNSTSDTAIIAQYAYGAASNEQWLFVTQAAWVSGRAGAKKQGDATITILTKNNGIARVSFDGKDLNGTECTITDLNGKRLHTEAISSGQDGKSGFSLHPDIPKGAYIIRVRSMTLNDSRKVIIR